MVCFTFLAVTIFLLAAIQTTLAQGSVQYCHKDPSVPIHFCLAMNTGHNASSSSNNLLVTFGYQRVSQGGWTAIGLGSGMLGALMFVEYAEKGNGRMTICFIHARNTVTELVNVR